jgi:MYXO-CTERM domain-containing protein
MLLVSFVSLASAASPLHDALLQRFEDTSGQGGCLTGLVRDLKANWGEFTPAERARMTSVLAPFKQDLLDEPRRDAPPRTGFAATTCFGQYGENQITGDHFAVEWDDGSVSQATAEAFLDDLEYGYEVEVEEHGWQPPAGDGDYLMLAYIADQNTGGAYTTVESCGGIYAPYIVAGKDAVSYGAWTEEMAAHEFNHSLQFNYSFAPEFWWWEATATYIEDIVRPNTNGWADYVTGYASNPNIALNASSQSDQEIFWHMYGMAIWGFYLNDWQGGEETVRATWENAASQRGQYDYSAKQMVRDLGLDWQDTYIDFITRNVSMDYDQHRFFPTITEYDHVRSLPASGEGSGTARPQGYGQNYIRISGGEGAGDLHVTFHGDSDTSWAFVVAETDGTHVTRSVSTVAQDGEGDLTLEDYGDDDVFLVVSPLDEADDKHGYSWEAELVAPVATDDTGTADTDGTPDGTDDGTDDANPDADGGVEIDSAGCGCATPAASPGSAWLVGLAVLAARRRARKP